MYRASVTANNTGNPGADAEVLIDGSESPITASGLSGYTPLPGDRLIVDKVGNRMEVVQFVSTGTVPYVAEAGFAAAVAGVVNKDYTYTGGIHTGDLVVDGTTLEVPGLLTVPLDGSGDAYLVGHLTGKSATFEDNTNLRGLTTLEGRVVLQNGIGAPTVPPSFQQGGALYETIATVLVADSVDWVRANVRSMVKRIGGTGNHHIVTFDFFGSGFRSYDMDTGADDPTVFGAVGDPALAESAQFRSNAKITAVGSFYYVIAQRSSDFKWGIDKYDSTLTFVSNFATGIAYVGEPTIGTDGTDVITSWVTAAKALWAAQWNATTGALVSSKKHHTFAVAENLRAVLKGDFDHAGITRWYFQTTKGVVISTDNAATPLRATAYEFPSASGWSYALSWDGTRFLQMDNAGYVRRYSTGRPASVAYTSVYTWFDDVATDHESTAGPQTTTTILARRPFTITTPVAPQAGGVGGDVADEVNVYVGLTAGTRYLVANLNVNVTVTPRIETIPTSGATPPLSNGFDLVAITPGKLVVQATRTLDGDREKFLLDGSGAGRFDAVMPCGAVLPYFGSSAPAGGEWLLCNGGTFLESDHPDLAALLAPLAGGGYVVSGTAPNRTMATPNLGDRAPMGSSGTKALGTIGGADAAALPNHVHDGTPLGTSTFTHNIISNAPTSGATAKLTGPAGHAHNVTGNTGNPTTNPNVATIPKYVSVTYIIKT